DYPILYGRCDDLKKDKHELFGGNQWKLCITNRKAKNFKTNKTEKQLYSRCMI
ncbi:5306_t:CDS:2, partial [Racocetra persica]